jgi:hypothetical protein
VNIWNTQSFTESNGQPLNLGVEVRLATFQNVTYEEMLSRASDWDGHCVIDCS